MHVLDLQQYVKYGAIPLKHRMESKLVIYSGNY